MVTNEPLCVFVGGVLIVGETVHVLGVVVDICELSLLSTPFCCEPKHT